MQIRLVLLFLACAFAAAAASSGRVFSLHTRWHELEAKGYNFEHYKQEFNKVYAHANEELTRRHIFEANLKKIITHNKSPSTWKAGVNHLTDRTESELAALRGHRKHFNVHPDIKASREALSAPVPAAVRELAARPKDLPTSVDWRLKGAVTPVKDQGQCGSCWTFASTETIESAWFLRTGQLFELSEQQVASCTSNPQDCGGTGGCEGGTAEVAFQGVITAGGISSEWMYPYTSWNGTDYTCRMNGGDPYFRFAPFANLSSYVKLPVNDQNTLLAAISTIGPIAISVDASAWSAYESGVFSGCNAANPTIDHAVQLVGYGTDPANGPYWLVRNSWTATWGEMGYIRIARPDTPACGVDTAPGDGTACKPYPATQTVCGMCGILSDSAYPIVGV